MTKHRWRGSLNSFSNHIDPQKEEQLRWIKIGKQPETFQFHRRIWDTALKPNRMHFKACLLAQSFPERGILWHTEWQLIRKIEEKVKLILKITRNINHGNKERNLRKKSEAIQLIEDFHKQYESLYSLYVDLREQVKKKVGDGDGDDDRSSSSDSDLDSKALDNDKVSSDTSKASDNDNQESETSDLEDTILKDKLTSSSEVKKIMNSESESPSSSPQGYVEVYKDLEVEGEESENKTQMLARIKDLEGQIDMLKIEVSTLSTQKTQLEEQLGCKSNEAMQMEEKMSKLEAQILEMKVEYKEKQSEFNSLEKCYMDNEQHYSSRIADMQLELNMLKHHKEESEETEQFSSQVNGLMEQVNSLQQEVLTMNNQKDELKLALEKKSEETLECRIQIEVQGKELNLSEQRMAQEKERMKAQVNDLEKETKFLCSKKSELEDQVKKLNYEAFQSSLEKEKLQERISELQTSLSKRENEACTEQMKFKDSQAMTSMQIKSLEEGVENLKSKLDSLQNENHCLQMELETLRNDKKILIMELDKGRESSSQLEKISRSNIQLVERKIEELAAEFRKQYDDQYRILSRRITVAEQLQVESKEWYRKTRDKYEQETKDLTERAEKAAIELKSAEDLTRAANKLLTSLDSHALKFEKCSADLVNRISKASCELNFAKQWAMRKNEAVLHVKDDLDCLLAQLDEKEAEILAFREKVWKLENKTRELEKIIKERNDEKLELNEEKREAIRQLCVWIDYHRGRSDFYKKILSDMNTKRKTAS